MLAVLLIVASVCMPAADARAFDMRDHRIPPPEIISGGPPKDGIAALDAPVFVAADQALELEAQDEVIGVEFDGVSRAYPLAILI